MKQSTRTLIAAAVVLAASAAHAASVRFTITGDYSATWLMESSVVPSDFQAGSGFVVWSVLGTFSATSVADISFFNTAHGGGLNIYDFQAAHNLLATDGPQLYSGSESTPAFRLGSFSLSEFQGSGSYTLNVAEVSSVPEPASIALTLAGLGVLAATRRRRPAR